MTIFFFFLINIEWNARLQKWFGSDQNTIALQTPYPMHASNLYFHTKTLIYFKEILLHSGYVGIYFWLNFFIIIKQKSQRNFYASDIEQKIVELAHLSRQWGNSNRFEEKQNKYSMNRSIPINVMCLNHIKTNRI